MITTSLIATAVLATLLVQDQQAAQPAGDDLQPAGLTRLSRPDADRAPDNGGDQAAMKEQADIERTDQAGRRRRTCRIRWGRRVVPFFHNWAAVILAGSGPSGGLPARKPRWPRKRRRLVARTAMPRHPQMEDRATGRAAMSGVPDRVSRTDRLSIRPVDSRQSIQGSRFRPV